MLRTSECRTHRVIIDVKLKNPAVYTLMTNWSIVEGKLNEFSRHSYKPVLIYKHLHLVDTQFIRHIIENGCKKKNEEK